MADVNIPDNAKCLAAAAICTHTKDHPCRECHVAAWAALQSGSGLVLAAELEQLRAAATEHLNYAYDDVIDRRTEMREGDFVSAEALDERIAELRGES